MSTEQIVINRLKELPEHLQKQVLDYLEFLIVNFSKTGKTDEKDDFLSDEQKKILSDRHEKYKNDPFSGENWDLVKKRLLEKYAV
jgi:hypothetical protein